MCILFLYHALGDPPHSPESPPNLGFNTISSSIGKTNTPSVRPSAAYNGTKSSQGGLGGRYKLIVASNRDEYMERPTSPIHFWKDTGSNLLAGRDLAAGGTWLGVSRSGKFATVTNIPSTWDHILALSAGWTVSTALASTAVAAAVAAVTVAQRRSRHGWGSSSLGLFCAAGVLTASMGMAIAASAATRRSRGALVADFLKGDEDAQTYCMRLAKERWRYPGFNLVLVDPSSAWVLSNKGEQAVTRLPHGFYGVSNATLDTPWTKMLHGKSRVLQVLLRLAADSTLTEEALVDLLMDILADNSPCPREGNASRSGEAWWNALARICVPPTESSFSMWNGRGWGGTKSTEAQTAGETTPVAVSPDTATHRPTRYGTRSSTVVLVDASGRMKVVERNLGDGRGVAMRDAERNTFEFCDV